LFVVLRIAQLRCNARKRRSRALTGYVFPAAVFSPADS
jgi:hypothetical protein